MKKRPNPATAHTQSRQRGAQTTSRSSALVRGRSTQFIANPCRWPQRPCPETRLHFCHFPAVLDHLCSNLSQSFHPIPLPCASAFPSPSHRDATTPRPCWAPHFMTQERSMFSNPTPSKPRLSPAATINDGTPSALTPSLHCASIRSCSLQPLLKLSLLSIRPSLLQFDSIVSPLLNHGNPIFEPVCVFYFFLFCLYFSDRNELQL